MNGDNIQWLTCVIHMGQCFSLLYKSLGIEIQGPQHPNGRYKHRPDPGGIGRQRWGCVGL